MAGRTSERAEALMRRLNLTYDHLLAIRFAINVAIATTIVWYVLTTFTKSSPIWAIASMVAASDPQPVEAGRMFKARLINVIVGCVVGLAFLLFGAAKQWMLPIALAVTVLISSFIIRVKTMWRQAPITAAIVIAAALMTDSAESGMQRGLEKIVQVIFGCIVGLIVSWLMSHLWLVKQPPAEKTAAKLQQETSDVSD
ncbi:MAG TPA: FUSC family protein [Parafilimonas sp.]|nr:FUSC family protein [Parafilimonas sp.]